MIQVECATTGCTNIITRNESERWKRVCTQCYFQKMENKKLLEYEEFCRKENYLFAQIQTKEIASNIFYEEELLKKFEAYWATDAQRWVDHQEREIEKRRNSSQSR